MRLIPSNCFPDTAVTEKKKEYFAGCSRMWAQVLFVQYDTPHINSSTSQQTSANFVCACVCVFLIRVVATTPAARMHAIKSSDRWEFYSTCMKTIC